MSPIGQSLDPSDFVKGVCNHSVFVIYIFVEVDVVDVKPPLNTCDERRDPPCNQHPDWTTRPDALDRTLSLPWLSPSYLCSPTPALRLSLPLP